MITISDNETADEIYCRVGDAGLYEVAHQAGMKSFSVAGYWANAQITADDMARFMWRLADVLDGPHRVFGLRLLGSVTETQQWGILRDLDLPPGGRLSSRANVCGSP